MIAVAPFQLRAAKSLAGKRTSKCTPGLLSLCAKWRYRCEQKYWDQLVHAPVLEQKASRRPVPTRGPRSPVFNPMSRGVRYPVVYQFEIKIIHYLRSVSALAFSRVLLGAEKVQRHIRLIANDPAVVRHRRNVKQIACVKFNYATIIERYCRGS